MLVRLSVSVIYVCLFVNMYFVNLSACISLCKSVSVFSVCLQLCLLVCLSFGCLSVCLHVFLYVCLSFFHSDRLPVCQFIYCSTVLSTVYHECLHSCALSASSCLLFLFVRSSYVSPVNFFCICSEKKVKLEQTTETFARLSIVTKWYSNSTWDPSRLPKKVFFDRPTFWESLE